MTIESNWRVPYVDLPARYAVLQPTLGEAVAEVLASGRFVNGPRVADLEERLAHVVGGRYVVAVNSGYDAIFLTLKAFGVGPGHEVITVSHTFVATVAAIVHTGATPVLVDVGEDGLMDPDSLGAALTSKTRAVIPVHLNGCLCQMETISMFADKKGLPIIQDAAQAIGAADAQGHRVGTYGNTACFSLHPLKTVSAAGDAGFVSTNNIGIYNCLRQLRNHGYEKDGLAVWGYNSRMDEVQAVIVAAQLDHLTEYVERRREIARRYDEALRGVVVVPPQAPGDTFSSYVIRAEWRDSLRVHLTRMGVETFVHWPVPLHLQPRLGLEARHPLPVTERLSGEVLSLPIYPEMSCDQQRYVVLCVRAFYGG